MSKRAGKGRGDRRAESSSSTPPRRWNRMRIVRVALVVNLLLIALMTLFPKTIRDLYARYFYFTEVEKGLFVRFPDEAPSAERDALAKRFAADHAHVGKLFGRRLEHPVLLEFRDHAFFAERGLENTWGGYYGTHFDAERKHLIAIDPKGLSAGYLRHELAHAWVRELNPGIALYRNEGIAHFVEPEAGAPHFGVNFVRAADLLDFPPASGQDVLTIDAEHPETRRLRAAGWALTYALVHRERWSLHRVAAASAAEIPNPDELIEWTRSRMRFAEQPRKK